MIIDLFFFKIDENQRDEIQNFLANSTLVNFNFHSLNELSDFHLINNEDHLNLLLLNITDEKLELLSHLKEKNIVLPKTILLSNEKNDLFDYTVHNIVDFQILPIDLSLLLTAINRGVNKFIYEYNFYQKKFADEKFQKFVPISTTKKIELIKTEDIVYFEADGRYTKLYLTNGIAKMASRNLGEFQNLLDPTIFCRIHHKFIVNLNKLNNIIKSDGYYCEMINSKNIPVSKRKFENLSSILNIGKNAL